MTTLTTRGSKGSELTHNELDANFDRDVQVKTTTYACLVSDNRSVIECNHATTPFTVTLGDAATMAAADTGDYEVTISNIGAAAVTVARAGSDTIDGGSTSITLNQYESVTLKVNGATDGYNSIARGLGGLTSTVTELNILDGVTASTEDLNATANFEETISATTSEVTIATGKTLNIADDSGLKLNETAVTAAAAELNLNDGASSGTIVNSKSVIYGASGEVNATTLQIAGTSITSTAAELNILDGVTSNASELNELDASAAAVTGYNSGIRTYCRVPSGSGFTVTSLITNDTWETVGPTGSGATNIWTQLDSAPSGVSGYLLRVYSNIQGATSGSAYQNIVHGVKNGDTETSAPENTLLYHRHYNHLGTNQTWTLTNDVVLPCDGSGIISIHWVNAGTSPTSVIYLYLVGFIV